MGRFTWLCISVLLTLSNRGTYAGVASINGITSENHLPGNCTTEKGFFNCNNGRCISLNSTCNTSNDCGDNSDEDSTACNNFLKECAENMHCSHSCHATPKGPTCSCPPTHRLISNQTCQDMNKPLAYPEDNILLYKTVRGRGKFDLSTNQSKYSVNNSPPKSSYTFIPLHARNQRIFQTSVNGYTVETIVTEMALDGITGNSYFSEISSGQIKVRTNTLSHCTVVIDGEKPMAIALHPAIGKMYWSDCGHHPHISRAQMNGKSQVLMVTDNLYCADDIIIDYPKDRLYWADSRGNVIESINLDGTDRKTVLHTHLTSQDSIAVLGDRLFWSELSTIHYCNKFTGEGQGVLLQGADEIVRLNIESPVGEPPSHNPCKGHSCEEMCVLADDHNYTCSCSPYKTLRDDGKSCERIKYVNHLIIATAGILIDYHHSIQGISYWDRMNTSDHFAEVYNPTNQSLLNNNRQAIFEEILRTYGVSNVTGGVAFDHIGNRLYLADVENKSIEIMSLVTLEKTRLKFSEEPRSILLIPELSIMFVTLCDVSGCHIDKMSMTGRDRILFLKDNLVGPQISLAFDTETERIYWADQGTLKIESVSLNGTDRKLFVSNIMQPVSLAIHGTEVFWTQKNSLSLYRADKKHPDRQAFETIITGLNSMYLIPTPGNSHSIIAAGKNLFGYYPRDLEKSYYRIDTPDHLAKFYKSTNQSLSNNHSQMIFDKISHTYGINEIPGGVAFDNIGNNFYSIDVQQNIIEIMSIATLEKTPLKFSEEPRSILLIPELSIMFVTLCNISRCHIDRMSMTGSERTRFLNDSFLGPQVSLAFDTETERVFWADQGTGRIESVFLNGTDRKLFYSYTNDPLSLAIHEGEVFWTQKKNFGLYWIDKQNDDQVSYYELTNGFDIMHLITTRGNYTGEPWSLSTPASGSTDQLGNTASQALLLLVVIGFIF